MRPNRLETVASNLFEKGVVFAWDLSLCQDGAVYRGIAKVYIGQPGAVIPDFSVLSPVTILAIVATIHCYFSVIFGKANDDRRRRSGC